MCVSLRVCIYIYIHTIEQNMGNEMCAGDRGPETEEMKERKTIRVHDPNNNHKKNSNGGRNRRREKW